MVTTTTATSAKPVGPDPSHAGAWLEIDLDAIRHNYKHLCRLLGNTDCAAVLKADAYGLGIDAVAPALWSAGARLYFVAHYHEGLRLRQLLPEARIYILHGMMPGAEADFAAHDLIPVLNTPGQINAWSNLAQQLGRPLPAILHVDTGMHRLGLSIDEADELSNQTDQTARIRFDYLMSHLACADDPDHGLNKRQLRQFQSLCQRFPGTAASLSNSAGIFLGTEYHFDLARPGIAVTGANPTPYTDNPMRATVRLMGRILQVQDVDVGETVGYGAAYKAARPMRVATIPVGYADGYLRCLGDRASAKIAGQVVPIIGRVSMDLITIDISAVTHSQCQPGEAVELIGDHISVDDLAGHANTISYEILTSLGSRYARRYIQDGN